MPGRCRPRRCTRKVHAVPDHAKVPRASIHWLAAWVAAANGCRQFLGIELVAVDPILHEERAALVHPLAAAAAASMP
eukprot:scaffold146093_cov22-Tisochrysis_lutea.AAC.1